MKTGRFNEKFLAQDRKDIDETIKLLKKGRQLVETPDKIKYRFGDEAIEKTYQMLRDELSRNGIPGSLSEEIGKLERLLTTIDNKDLPSDIDAVSKFWSDVMHNQSMLEDLRARTRRY